jgi:hypothetical protein
MYPKLITAQAFMSMFSALASLRLPSPLDRDTRRLSRGTATLLVTICLGVILSGCARTEGESTKTTSEAEEVFSGVNQFWTIASLLEQGGNPSAEQWNALANSPGYRYYFADAPEALNDFKQRMRLVFRPENQKALNDTLEAVRGQFDSSLRTLHVLLAAKRHQDELKAFREKLSFQDVKREAEDEAAKLLPDGSFSDDSGRRRSLSVGMNIYNLAGRSTADGFVVDFLMLRHLGRKGAKLLLAHETHHVGRTSQLDVPNGSEDPRSALLRTIDDLQAEGIADLIDKPHALKRFASRPSDLDVVGTEWARAYLQGLSLQHKRAYEATPATLQKVDSLVVAAGRADANGDDEALAKISAQVARATPNKGHPNGHYMATLIADQIGTDSLANTAENPFAFLDLYNRAARQSSRSAQPLSPEAVEYLNELEKTYISNSRP